MLILSDSCVHPCKQGWQSTVTEMYFFKRNWHAKMERERGQRRRRQREIENIISFLNVASNRVVKT